MSGMADRSLDPDSLGFAHFLPKPFTPSALLAAITKALSQPAAEEPKETQRPAVS
jgi:hypothetical protein